MNWAERVGGEGGQPPMSGERSRARQAGYDLLARLFLEEPDVELVRALRDLPGFAELIPPDEALGEWLEALAVEYQRLFGMNVYPYESLFVDRELMLNTAATARVTLLYQEAGFDATGARTGAPDHLGLELRLMRDLARREQHAGAWARRLRARCLREHLARWAPLCALTVARVTVEPLYRLLATLTTDLVLSDLTALPPAPPARPGVADQSDGPPPPVDDLDETLDAEAPGPLRPYGDAGSRREAGADPDERGLNALVRQLITPVDSGLLLTRADLTRLAGTLDLPVAIGDRFQMLRGLFTAAGQYEQLPALLTALAALIAAARTAVAALLDEYPAWAPYGQAWLDRLDASHALLGELLAQATAPG